MEENHKVDKVGTNKYEIYINKKGYKKIITIYESENTLICITRLEGRKRL